MYRRKHLDINCQTQWRPAPRVSISVPIFTEHYAPPRRAAHYNAVMRAHIRVDRQHRHTRPEIRVTRPAAIVRPIAKVTPAHAYRGTVPALTPVSFPAGIEPDPYVDYGRALTPEGGILIAYKTYDDDVRHILWRLFAWTIATGFEGWFLLCHSPVHAGGINLLCLLAMAVINWLIVSKPVEIYRKIEIRPDCMILDGTDIFWRRHMENDWPAFKADEKGNQILCGTYGTRFVEYLTVPRFDEFDRVPEVFAAHLRNAMMQLWTKFI